MSRTVCYQKQKKTHSNAVIFNFYVWNFLKTKYTQIFSRKIFFVAYISVLFQMNTNIFSSHMEYMWFNFLFLPIPTYLSRRVIDMPIFVSTKLIITLLFSTLTMKSFQVLQINNLRRKVSRYRTSAMKVWIKSHANMIGC